MDNKNEIIEKIKKLLALADTNKNASIEEAIAAAKKVSELLLKHGLTEGEVANSQSGEDRYGKYNVVLDANQSSATWHGQLYWIIARANGCKMCILSGRLKIWVVGKPANIEICHYLYVYLYREIEKLYKQAVAAETLDKGTKNKADFIHGCLYSIDKMFKDSIQKAETDTPAIGTALTVSKDQLGAAFRALVGATRIGTSRGRRVGAGYGVGQTAGSGIGMAKGVTGRGQLLIA